MEEFDYYKAPKQEIFEEIKTKSIEIWQHYDNTYGYVDEKVNYITPLKNIKDNAWTIVAMFDIFNQARLYKKVNKETKEALSEMHKWSYGEEYKNMFGIIEILYDNKKERE